MIALTQLRKFETKLGERIRTPGWKEDLFEAINSTPAKYVLFGIPEDIGVRANYGIGGADSAWQPFLSAFLNLQSNDFLSGENILYIGYFDFSNLKYLIEQNAYNHEEKIDAYRHAVVTIDEEVEKLSKIISHVAKVPVAIGGGHNNAYPIIKGCSKGLHSKINCVNLDAHAAFRAIEGRHSGNPFRYAEEDGYLEKYFIVGFHENYIPQNILLDLMNNRRIGYITYEDIFVREKFTFARAVSAGVSFTEGNGVGVELDLDSIEDVLASAETPSGIQSCHARQYIHRLSMTANVVYLHICEGASKLANGRTKETTGKLISYLVSDFIKTFG